LNSRSISTTIAWLTLFLLLLAIVIALVWANLQWVEYFPQESEFFQRWQITQGLIFERINPYEPVDGYAFTSPFPLLVFYFPFALIKNYALAQALWISVLQIATVVFAYLSIRTSAWEINRWLMGIIFVFALFWFPAISVFSRGSEAALMTALFTAALLSIQKGRIEIAGVFLALSTLDLPLTLLAVTLVLIWVISQGGWPLIFWATATIFIASGIGLIFLPSWPVDYFLSMLRYVDFRVGQSILETTTRWWPGIGLQIGWGVMILSTILLIVEWWLVWGKNERRLTWTLALTLAVSIWIGFETTFDQVFFLLFSLIVIFAAWNRRWKKPGMIFTLSILILLLPGSWWSAVYFAQTGLGEAPNPILMIAFPLIVIVALYWIRWWYLRPEYLILSES
jgi:hypothetical protein